MLECLVICGLCCKDRDIAHMTTKTQHISRQLEFQLGLRTGAVTGNGMGDLGRYLQDIRYDWYNGGGVCPHHDTPRNSFVYPSLRNAQISEISTCPWDYAWNNDTNRIPESFIEAGCKCQSCGGTEEGGICVPLLQYSQMFRKCAVGASSYREVWEPIAIGCTCVYPPVRRQPLGRILMPR